MPYGAQRLTAHPLGKGRLRLPSLAYGAALGLGPGPVPAEVYTASLMVYPPAPGARASSCCAPLCWKQPVTGEPIHSPGGSPAKQRDPATRATGVRRSYRRQREQYTLWREIIHTAGQPPRAAAQRRGHMALPMDTCGDTLSPRTPGPGGLDTAFPSTCGSGLRGT